MAQFFTHIVSDPLINITGVAALVAVSGNADVFPDFNEYQQAQVLAYLAAEGITPGGGGGTTWLYGVGVPSDGTGANGNYYLSTSNGAVYVKASGTWGAAVYTPSGGASPLTTKGDLYGHSTVDARVPVGADGTALVADSTQALGVRWQAPPVISGVTRLPDTATASVSAYLLGYSSQLGAVMGAYSTAAPAYGLVAYGSALSPAGKWSLITGGNLTRTFLADSGTRLVVVNTATNFDAQYSTNLGATWGSATIGTGFVGGNLFWDSVNSRFVTAGYDGNAPYDYQIFTSPDGATWTAHDSGVVGDMPYVLAGAVDYVALFKNVGTTFAVIYTTDPAFGSWTSVTTPENLVPGSYAPAGVYDGTHYCLLVNDSTGTGTVHAWHGTSLASLSIVDTTALQSTSESNIVAQGGGFIAFISSDNKYWYSSDHGATWNSVASALATLDSLVYNPVLGVFVGGCYGASAAGTYYETTADFATVTLSPYGIDQVAVGKFA